MLLRFVNSPISQKNPIMTFVSSVTSSGQASIIFTSLSNTYRGYRFYLSNLQKSGLSSVGNIKISIDNGSSFISSNYVFINQLNDGVNLGTTNTSGTQTSIPFDIASSINISGIFDMYYQGDANNLISYEGNINSSGVSEYFGGFYNQQANVNSIEFNAQGRTWSSGTIYMYGIT